MTEYEIRMLAEAKARMNGGHVYASADGYYAEKDLIRRLEAKARGKRPHEHDPMGHWFGMPSN